MKMVSTKLTDNAAKYWIQSRYILIFSIKTFLHGLLSFLPIDNHYINILWEFGSFELDSYFPSQFRWCFFKIYW